MITFSIKLFFREIYAIVGESPVIFIEEKYKSELMIYSFNTNEWRYGNPKAPQKLGMDWNEIFCILINNGLLYIVENFLVMSGNMMGIFHSNETKYLKKNKNIQVDMSKNDIAWTTLSRFDFKINDETKQQTDYDLFQWKVFKILYRNLKWSCIKTQSLVINWTWKVHTMKNWTNH